MSVEKYQCPECGAVRYLTVSGPLSIPSAEPARPGLHLVNGPGPGWQQLERRQVSMGQAVTAFTPTEYERLTPVRPASVQSDVVVPFLSALISAAALTGLLLVACWYLEMPAWPALVCGLLAFFGFWLVFSAYHRGLLVQSEYQRVDAPPAAEPARQKRVRLEVAEKGRRQYADLPIDVDRLQAVARAIAGGRAFSVANMTGRGKPLSRGEFETLREWLLTYEYLRWIDAGNRQAGTTFTARGKALIRGLAE